MKSQLNPSHFPMKITKSPIIPINKIPGVQGARRFPVESILEPAAVRKPCDSARTVMRNSGLGNSAFLIGLLGKILTGNP